MDNELTEQEKVEAVAYEVDGTVRKSYSGRGMYGKSCMGVVCENPNSCLEIAGSKGLFGAKVDSMGLKSIVYWPDIPSIESDEDEDEEEDD